MLRKLFFEIIVRLLPFVPYVKKVVPRSILSLIRGVIFKRMVSKLPDRVYMMNEILPALKEAGVKKILFIGVDSFTTHYSDVFAGTGTEYWTMDINPEIAKWGEPGHHVVCDAQELEKHFPVNSFDVVIANGVFGYGINEKETVTNTIQSVYRILIENGLLIIGWPLEVISEPVAYADMQDCFKHTSPLAFDKHVVFESLSGRSHVYDTYVMQSCNSN